jgi:hypothetical protein
MGEETEHITVAETSDGPGGSRPAGETVSLPVVELLTGRGFVTGKSGSGKSNSASVIAEQLLDSEFGLLIVDIDGEYYGLKEEYEILHVGADEECDIQVTTEHAEKLAGLALEQNVPIILDVSSYLDEGEAEAMLTEVARSLFAKAKKQKQPFLLLVEEIHEYIPEQGSVGECGKMLIKIGKRGRKHGLGLCGISQRPADVKKDFITQCDWLLWHRLTWQNDTRVVRRILDGEYADAVEDLDDGEGFLVTDWTDDVRRVQFYRKETFDAGATPGLEDVERPDLKSVSEDLVSELAEISDEASARDDRIAELESTLERREARIEELEQELRDARDLQDLAEQFVTALTSHPTTTTGGVPDTAGGEVVRDRSTLENRTTATEWPGGWREREEPVEESTGETEESEASGNTDEKARESGGGTDRVDDAATAGEEGEESFSAQRILSKLEGAPAPGDDDSARTPREEIELELYSDVEVLDDGPGERASGDAGGTESDPRAADGGAATAGGAAAGSGGDPTATHSETAGGASERDTTGDDTDTAGQAGDRTGDAGEASDQSPSAETAGSQTGDAGEADDQSHEGQSEAAAGGETSEDTDVSAQMPEDEPLVVRELKATIAGLETKTRRMLAFYREQGPASAQNAHFAAGGDGNRTQAYARNRTLRTRGLIGHVGRGQYDYRLREHLAAELGDYVDEAVVDVYATEIEETALDVEP